MNALPEIPGTRDELSRRRSPNALISVVLPAWNEAAVLRTLFSQISSVLDDLECRSEIVFVNDGSQDGTDRILDELADEDPRVRVVHFSRNFGHQAAVKAGLDTARGDAVVVMDSDMQDAPEAILGFVEKWRDGYDVVYAVRTQRKEGPVKRLLFRSFYRVLNSVSNTPIPRDAGNFGLVDRAVVDQLNRIGDRDRYYPGLRSWVGFRQTGMPVERGRRYDDQPRVSLAGLFRLAKTAIFSFSSVPLSAFYVIAAMSLLTCGAVTAFTLYHKLVTGLATPGWASLTIVASFFGALNALGIGILGEYAIRIYDQVRARPSYIIARTRNLDAPQQSSVEHQLLEWLSESWSTSESVDSRV